MELTTRRNDKAIVDTATTSAIAQRYGHEVLFHAKFMPVNLPSIYSALDKSVEAGVPSVVNAAKTYGDDSLKKLLSLHIEKVMIFNGIAEEEISRSAVSEIAELMLMSEKFRTLNLAFALSFFQECMIGKFSLYGCKPINFLNAMQDYCKGAHLRQRELYRRKEKTEQERAATEAKANAVTFEQYCASRGLNPETANPLDFIARAKAEQTAKAKANKERQAYVQAEMQTLVQGK